MLAERHVKESKGTLPAALGMARRGGIVVYWLAELLPTLVQLALEL